jgi:hypothetical protein
MAGALPVMMRCCYWKSLPRNSEVLLLVVSLWKGQPRNRFLDTNPAMNNLKTFFGGESRGHRFVITLKLHGAILHGVICM